MHEIANIMRAIITVLTMYGCLGHLSTPSGDFVDPHEQLEVFLLGVHFKWEEKIEELIVYKEKNGNCNVPKRQSALGIWVQRQRQCHKNGKLS